MITISKKEYEELLKLKKKNEKLKEVEKALEDQFFFMKNLLDAIPIPIFYKDENARFLGFNKEYEEVFGVVSDNLIGKRVLDLEYLSKEDREKYQAEDEDAIKNAKMIKHEQLMPYQDGKIHTTLYYVSGFKKLDGTPAGLIGVFIDITEINEAKKRAEELVLIKSQFLANMSHEIRTPLNGVIGLNSLLLETELSQTQKEYLEKSINSSKVLLGIINDILDFSKIEAGKLELIEEEFDLEKLLKESVDLFEAAISKKSVELHIDFDYSIPKYLIGDSLRVSQIINNLLGNAVKFTEYGDITIKIKPKNISNNDIELEISVIDTGIGILQNNIEKLFASFSQADASNTRKYGGSGLGLNITKKLINLMGGDIKVKSELQYGSEFYFNINLKVANHELSKELKDFENSIFLVVDDNEIERNIIVSILKSWNIHPFSCSNGFDAIKLAKDLNIDYLIVDWKMPKLNGFDVIKEIETQNNPNLKRVIMISAYEKEELLKSQKEAGVNIDKVLSKPVTKSQLQEAILESNISLSNKNIETKKYFKGKILLAEDNETNQLVAKDILKNMGLEVDIASNGEEAVELYNLNKYDLILMDLQMPVLDGFEATKKIREIDSKIPIIALSAAVMQSDKDLTSEAKMNAHLAKPIEIDKLSYELSKYLKSSVIKIENRQTILEIPKIEGINLDRLSSLYSDISQVFNLLKMFVKMAYETLNELFTVDKEEIKSLIHKLKGSSANIGANEIYKLCIKYEQSDSILYKENIIEQLKISLENIIINIEKALESNNLVKSEILSKQALISRLDILILKLEENELIENYIDLLDSINSYIEDDLSLSNALQEAIDSFEYDDAIKIVQKVKNILL